MIKTKVELADIAQAILDRRALDARQFTQDLWAETADFATVPKPATASKLALILSAALVELFAMRRGDQPPAWTEDVNGVATPMFLIPEFEQIPYQRERCLRTSPPPLRSRNLFAPDNFLSFV